MLRRDFLKFVSFLPLASSGWVLKTDKVINKKIISLKLDGIKFYNNNLSVELSDGSKIIFKDIKKL